MKKTSKKYEDPQNLSFKSIIEKEIGMVKANRYMSQDEKKQKIRQLEETKEGN